MINIAVCEDEISDKELLDVYIGDVAREMMLEYHVDFFQRGSDLLESAINGGCYDLIVLDIIMEGMNGIETARELREIRSEVSIGFMTNSADFALDAFEIDAIHYIIKPVDKAKVKKMMLRFMERFGKPVELLTLNTSKGQVALPMNSILKVESYKKGVEIYSSDAKEPRWFRCSFMSVEEQLDKARFLRIARGLVVNMDYIEHMEPAVCCFMDGTSALISRSVRAEVRRQYNDYLFSRMKAVRERNKND